MEFDKAVGRKSPGFSPEELFSLMMRISSRAPLARDFYLELAKSVGGRGLSTGKGTGDLFAGCASEDVIFFSDPIEIPPGSAMLVVSPLCGVSLTASLEELGTLFVEVAQALAEGGVFAFDLDNFHGWGRAADGAMRVVGSGRLPSGAEAVLSESRSLLPGGRKSYCRIGVEELDGLGKVRSKSYCTLSLLSLTQKKILELAKGAGLRLEGVFGGFGMEPLEPASPMQLWLFRKGAGEGG